MEEDAEVELGSSPGAAMRVEIKPRRNIRSNIFDIKHCSPIRCFRFEKPSWDSPGKKAPGCSKQCFRPRGAAEQKVHHIGREAVP